LGSSFDDLCGSGSGGGEWSEEEMRIVWRWGKQILRIYYAHAVEIDGKLYHPSWGEGNAQRKGESESAHPHGG